MRCRLSNCHRREEYHFTFNRAIPCFNMNSWVAFHTSYINCTTRLLVHADRCTSSQLRVTDVDSPSSNVDKYIRIWDLTPSSYVCSYYLSTFLQTFLYNYMLQGPKSRIQHAGHSLCGQKWHWFGFSDNLNLGLCSPNCSPLYSSPSVHWVN